MRPLPDFVIAGQPKSGTTALYQMLRKHPDVFMPGLDESTSTTRFGMKEPAYFCTDHVRKPMPEETYRSLFADALPHQMTGEATTSYLYSTVAARKLHDANPSARVIGIFREPVELLVSLHAYYRLLDFDRSPTLRQAIEVEEGRAGRKRSSDDISRTYLDRVHYSTQLQRFYDLFPRERVLVLLYDDYRADNVATLTRVFEFLGVRSTVQITPLTTNVSSGAHSYLGFRVLHRLRKGAGPIFGPSKRILSLVTTDEWRKRAFASASEKLRSASPSIDDALVGELKERFRPEVERFSDLVGRDLVHLWGY